jgi:hypothetical protein
VKEDFPTYGVGDVAKELGKRWEKVTNRTKFEVLAKADKARYEKVGYLIISSSLDRTESTLTKTIINLYFHKHLVK